MGGENRGSGHSLASISLPFVLPFYGTEAGEAGNKLGRRARHERTGNKTFSMEGILILTPSTNLLAACSSGDALENCCSGAPQC